METTMQIYEIIKFIDFMNSKCIIHPQLTAFIQIKHKNASKSILGTLGWSQEPTLDTRTIEYHLKETDTDSGRTRISGSSDL